MLTEMHATLLFLVVAVVQLDANMHAWALPILIFVTAVLLSHCGVARVWLGGADVTGVCGSAGILPWCKCLSCCWADIMGACLGLFALKTGQLPGITVLCVVI
jgi:hypothetical protein